MEKALVAVLCLMLIAIIVVVGFALRPDDSLDSLRAPQNQGNIQKPSTNPGTTSSSTRPTVTVTVPVETQIPSTNIATDTTVGSTSGAMPNRPSSTVTNPTISVEDNSDMDFEIDKDDQNPNPTTPGVDVDVSDTDKTEQTQGGNMFYITQAGAYTFTGVNEDVMLTVDAPGEKVQIILNGVTIRNSKGPAIYVRSADKVTITLAEGTVNSLSDGNSYSIEDSGSVLDGAVFSKGDLTINGTGKLVVNGNYKHGIVSKDDLVIVSGVLDVKATGAGLVGKDCVKIGDGNIILNAGSDGIRSDNEEDASLGYIYLSGGKISIVCGNDGVQAKTALKIDNVNLAITAGGGSSGSLTSSTESFKGLKAGSDIYINGGIFNINSKDDCIHSNGTITISGGNYTLSSGDDGVHADTDIAVSGSATKLVITKSYEGIEATNVVITGGEISIVATDDGINAAGGNNSTGSMGGMPGRPGQGGFNSSNGSIQITGGKIHIQMNGDGVDANGSLTIAGGTITISGANSGDTAILDFDTTGNISGGSFIGTGATGMAQNFSTSSTQCAALIKTGNQNAGTTVTLKDSSGKVLISYTADRAYSCVIVSIPEMAKGGAYTLTAGSYSVSFTMSGTIYSAGGSSNRPGGR